MTKTLLSASVAMFALLMIAEPATAQRRGSSRGGSSRPTTSPYLNLLRGAGGGGTGFNYYQRVRPEQEFRNANQQLSSSIDSLLSRLDDPKAQRDELKGGLNRTGHVPRFMNLGGYFPALGNQGSGSRGSGRR